MADGQQSASGQGSVASGLTLALVGIALTAAAGIIVPLGEGAAALSGQSATSAAGSFASVGITPRTGGLSFSPSLTGLQLVSSTGALYGTGRSLVQSDTGQTVASTTILLVGIESVSGQGLISPNADGTVPLVGASAQTATGTLLTPGTQALTGSVATGETGTLSVTLRPTDPVGQSITSATGTISIEANNVTVHITGEEIVSAQGAVDATPVLTGLASTSATGSVVPSHTVPLVGLASATSAGSVTVDQGPSEDTYIQSSTGSAGPSFALALTGLASTGATGTLAITGDVAQALTGTASTAEAGLLVPTPLLDLVGASCASAQSNLGAPGFGTLIGQSATVSTGTLFVTNDREQPLIGLAGVLTSGSLNVTEQHALAGTVVAVGSGTMGRSGGNMQQALTGISSTWNTGTVGIIGQDILPPGVSNEGCSIVSGVAQETDTSPSASGGEGCFIQSGTAKEVG